MPPLICGVQDQAPKKPSLKCSSPKHHAGISGTQLGCRGFSLAISNASRLTRLPDSLSPLTIGN